MSAYTSLLNKWCDERALLRARLRSIESAIRELRDVMREGESSERQEGREPESRALPLSGEDLATGMDSSDDSTHAQPASPEARRKGAE